MKISLLGKWLGSVALAATGFSLAIPSAAALCAVCNQSAAGAGERGIHALRLGIIVLGVPALTILVGILLFLFRYRNRDPLWEDGSRKNPVWDDSVLVLPAYEADSASSRL